MYTHVKGSTFSLVSKLLLTDNGVQVADLTGYTGACEIKTARGKQLVDANGNVMGILQFGWKDASQAIATLDATLEQQAWWPDTEDYLITDIKLTSPAGQVHRSLQAKIKVVGHVTS